MTAPAPEGFGVPARRFLAMLALVSGVMLCNLFAGALSTRSIWGDLETGVRVYRSIWLSLLGTAVVTGAAGFYRSLMGQRVKRASLTVFTVVSMFSFKAAGTVLNVLPLGLSLGVLIGQGSVNVNFLGVGLFFWYKRVCTTSSEGQKTDGSAGMRTQSKAGSTGAGTAVT